MSDFNLEKNIAELKYLEEYLQLLNSRGGKLYSDKSPLKQLKESVKTEFKQIGISKLMYGIKDYSHFKATLIKDKEKYPVIDIAYPNTRMEFPLVTLGDFDGKPEWFDTRLHELIDNCFKQISNRLKLHDLIYRRENEVKNRIREILMLELLEFLNTEGTVSVFIDGLGFSPFVASSYYKIKNDTIIVTNAPKKTTGLPTGHFPSKYVQYDTREDKRVHRVIKTNRFLKEVRNS